MARSKADRTQLIGHGPGRIRQARGRHRLGRPGLSHCRDLPAVLERLSAGMVTRHTTVLPRARLSAQTAVTLVAALVAGTVVVSGWYTGAGADVIASIVAP